jgi:hypothetical protein
VIESTIDPRCGLQVFMVVWEEGKDVDEPVTISSPANFNRCGSRTYSSSGRSKNSALSNEQDTIFSANSLVSLDLLSDLDDRESGLTSDSCDDGA